MQFRFFLVTAAIALAAQPALAGTKYQSNLPPAPADCFNGPGSCLNVDASCIFDNSECAMGTMSSKSSVKIDGKLSLKAKFSGVTDVAAVLMTTGPAETATDNLLLKVKLSTCVVDNGVPACDQEDKDLYLKVVLTDGKGKLAIDLAPVLLLSPGANLGILGVSLTGANPFCAGDNSTVGITARINDVGNCGSSVVRGSTGVIAE